MNQPVTRIGEMKGKLRNGWTVCVRGKIYSESTFAARPGHASEELVSIALSGDQRG
jgi:hypothetical protein